MQRLICPLLLLLTMASVADAQTRRRKSAPKTPRKEIIVRVEEPKTFGLSIDKYVSTHDVNADGTAVNVWEMDRRCSNATCLEIAKRLNYVYNADLQKVEVLEASILKPDGKKVAVPASAVKIRPTPHAEAATGFSSLHEVDIVFDGLKVGETARFKLKIATTKAMFDNHFDTMEFFPLMFDWKSIEINLSAPKDYALYTEAPGLEGGEPIEESGRIRRQWRKKDLSALEIEPAMYDLASASPRFAATSFKDHNQLGAAFWDNVKAKAVVTPEVKALADEITKDISDPKQQAYAIYDWVNKNIRYLLIVLDRGGWNPHTTTEILANRYGDCKDYTTIIYALLKAKSIESTPVLIRSDLGDWFPSVAVPDYFNHAVLYIPSLKLIADATAPNTRLGLIPQSLVGKKALLAGEQTGILEIPRDNPDDNEISSDVEIEMQPNGALKAVSRNTYKGRMEMVFRPMLANSLIRDNSDLFVKTLLSYYGVEGSGKIRKIGDPYRVGDPLTIEIEAELPNFTTFTPAGRFTLPVGINLTNTLELEQLVQTESRKTNLIAGAIRMRENFVIKVPSTVKVETVPAAVDFKNAIGRYRNEFKLVDGSVNVTREIVLFKDVIAPADYPQMRELVKKAVESHNIEIAYKADPSLLRAKAREVNRNTRTSRGASDRFGDPYNTLLPAAEAARLEAKLKTTPNDLETRKRLLRHYFSYEIKESAKVLAARMSHRLWMIKNHPELSEGAIYGISFLVDQFDSGEIGELKAEWLKQIAANKESAEIRLNAAEFFRTNEDESLAKQLLTEGVSLYPDRYEFPLRLSDVLYASLSKLENGDEAKRKEILRSVENHGETAIQRLKMQRSTERDGARNDLLVNLSQVVFELGKLDRAKELATELILEFGQSTTDAKFDDSSHIGNIVLGHVALLRGDTAKAKEHLLNAVRAPLRRDYSSLSTIDLHLAKELFEKGEKETVLEYLRLCEGLPNLKTYPETYADELKSLKAWQVQIKQGKRPSFEFGKDAPLP